MQYGWPKTRSYVETNLMPGANIRSHRRQYLHLGKHSPDSPIERNAMNALKQTIITASLLLAGIASATNARADVLEIKIDDQITPASAEATTSAITRA